MLPWTYMPIIVGLMLRLIVGAVLALGCGGVRSNGLATGLPGADASGAGTGLNADAEARGSADGAALDDATPGVGALDGGPVGMAMDVVATWQPDASAFAGDAAAPDAVGPAPDLSADTAPRPISSCSDNPALACGPRNERFPWSCIGRPCSSPIGVPVECMPYSPWLRCDCDMSPPAMGPSCAAADTTWSVRTAGFGVACRQTSDCGGRLLGMVACGPTGVCQNMNGGHCAVGGDCVSGFCSLVENTCGGPKGETCKANRECASYICTGGACE